MCVLCGGIGGCSTVTSLRYVLSIIIDSLAELAVLASAEEQQLHAGHINTRRRKRCPN